MRFELDNRPIPIQDGDTVLVAMLRAGCHPTGGGCLCLAGDCPHCLVAVDGVSYVRSCQVRARPGLVVARSHRNGLVPPLLKAPAASGSPPAFHSVAVRHVHCDAVVIGQGVSGREAAVDLGSSGLDVETLDSDPRREMEPREVIGIYPGPLVVARSGEELLHLHPSTEIVVATGASEIQPVAPGNDLEGLLTARAAEALAEAGFTLGRVVAIGTPPVGVAAVALPGELVRFEGSGKVRAVVVRDSAGQERRCECDTVSLGFGFQPRDALFRMARDLPVRVVGDAARESDLPPCPREGVVCPCSGVTVDDLEQVWRRGFEELELVKRATLAGTGTCQGACCIPHLRSFLRQRGKKLQPPFTARPVTRQLTIGEISAGANHQETPRTALHDEHLRLGARMERSSGWWRPWLYGEGKGEGEEGAADRGEQARALEYRAVREAVSLCDVGTLGKFSISGPDATTLLDHLLPTSIATLRPNRARYVLLLDERGYVLDDGVIARDSDQRFYLTLTSGGASFGELWIRDWAEALTNDEGERLDVRVLNQTMSLGAINVTGPLAAELLTRAGAGRLPRFTRHHSGVVAGVDCRILRLSFTGELSYELHHAAADSVELWRRLLELGRDLGIRPHGIDTLLDLRLEKGHLVVGKDTDFDSTPRRLDHEWAIDLKKRDFVGRRAVLRTNKIPLDRQLVGFEMEPPAPIDGAVLRTTVDQGREYVGYLTSSTESPRLGKVVMLGWLETRDGVLPHTVEIDGRLARRVPTPFYDPGNERARLRVSSGQASKRGDASAADRTEGSGRQNSSSEGRDSEVQHGGAWVRADGRFRFVEAVRIAAKPRVLDRLAVPMGELALRIAPDEVLIVAPELCRPSMEGHRFECGGDDDPEAVVVRETGFAGAWIPMAEASEFLERSCAWPIPEERPAFAQGAVADLPLKLWLESDRVLFLVSAALSHALEQRMES